LSLEPVPPEDIAEAARLKAKANNAFTSRQHLFLFTLYVANAVFHTPKRAVYYLYFLPKVMTFLPPRDYIPKLSKRIQLTRQYGVTAPMHG
jgi:hypothetical protein